MRYKNEAFDRDPLARQRRTGSKDGGSAAGGCSVSGGKTGTGIPGIRAGENGSITAYDRISDREIRVHSNIYEPDFVAVVDDTLLHTVDVTAGLKEDGGILINTVKSGEEILPLLKGYAGKVWLLDARKVCAATLGKYFPNTPMLAAMVKISGVMDIPVFLREMETSLQHKFARKPEVLEGNLKALRVALEEVTECV